MAISDILASIDCDIAQLQQARALLSGGAAPTAKKTAGRLKKVAGCTQEGSKKRRRGTSRLKGGSGSSRLSRSAGRRRRLRQQSNHRPRDTK
jgi:hypothetical protein